MAERTELPQDTPAPLSDGHEEIVTLSRSAQSSTAISKNEEFTKFLEVSGFYDRWLRKIEKHEKSSTFIGPELIAKRNPSATMDLLEGVYDVTIARNSQGVRAATGTGERPLRIVRGPDGYPMIAEQRGSFGRQCYLTVVVDNGVVCPKIGCHHSFAGDPPGSTSDDHVVDLDKAVDARVVAGIEVYPTKDGMPAEVLHEYSGCGVIVVWTRSTLR
jgi:hypothetical protein